MEWKDFGVFLLIYSGPENSYNPENPESFIQRAVKRIELRDPPKNNGTEFQVTNLQILE
jgi:hypothetical protein